MAKGAGSRTHRRANTKTPVALRARRKKYREALDRRRDKTKGA